jgi:signal transduction histidine kinase/ActR/RegA family two-component response regulator
VSESLLLRQIRKRLDLSAEQAAQLSSRSARELAGALRSAPPEALAALLEDVAATYHEADEGRRRLSHALQLSSDELYEANRVLAARAAEQATQLGLLNATLDATPEGVLVVDESGRTLLANERFAAMWHISIDVLATRDDETMLQQALTRLEDPDGFLRRVREIYGDPQAESFEEIQFCDGTVFERLTRPVRVAGQAVARIWVFRDVTAQRRAERERAQLEERLRQSQRMEAIGKLAGGVAHDFNNLLMAIMGYSEILLRHVADRPELEREVSGILTAAERAGDLTHQLLAFSRKQVLQPKVLDLNRVVTEVEKMVRRVIGEDIELTTRHGAELGPVKADPGQIEQVLLNLVVNARDAMPQGGALLIQTSNVHLDASSSRAHVDLLPGPYVRLEVSDTGCGMDAETCQHIFEPFFTTKERGKGTGLGLSTVYGIIKQSGGHIQVASELGKGSRFSILLPRVDSELAIEAPRMSGARAAGGEVILLVEDEEIVRKPIGDLLAAAGYQVLCASNGAEALEICRTREGPMHLLLTDVILPGLHGRELAERVRGLRPGIKVLFMSGYTDQAGFGQAALHPGDGFIYKPFSSAAVANKVRQALDQAPEAVRSST